MTAPGTLTPRGAAGGEAARFFGKYRGLVTDNADPRTMARVRARVPEILGDVETGWAMPCAPYAGERTGLLAVPEPGAGVWIEFEAGDVSRPIWSGCWWQSDKLPEDEAGGAGRPALRVFRSEEGLVLALHDDAKKIALSDANGSNLLTIEVEQGQVTVRATQKVVVEAPKIEVVEGATHPMVLGDDLVQYLTQVVTSFNTHTHPGETCAGVPVTPMVPAPPLSPPPSSVLSLKVTVG